MPTQRLLYFPHPIEFGKSTPPVDLPEKPTRVWTLFGKDPNDPPTLPIQPLASTGCGTAGRLDHKLDDSAVGSILRLASEGQTMQATNSAQISLKEGTFITRVTHTAQDFELSFHDDSTGGSPLWVIAEESGPWIVPRMVVCAHSFVRAYELALDELPTVESEELHEAYGMTKEDFDSFDSSVSEHPDLAEGYTHQSNASGTGIVYTMDLHVFPLTREYMEAHSMQLQIRSLDSQA